MNLDPNRRGLVKANRSLVKLRAKTAMDGEEEAGLGEREVWWWLGSPLLRFGRDGRRREWERWMWARPARGLQFFFASYLTK
jgi:hypothetical protein